MKDFGRAVARTGKLLCPHPTTPRRNMKQPLICSLLRPRLLSGTRRHSCCHRCPMARVYRFPSTDYWLIHVPLKPSPLPASPTRDFCHVASLHGSCGTEVKIYSNHRRTYEIPNVFLTRSMKNRKQIAKYVKVSLRFGYSQFLLYLCICFTAFNNLEMVSFAVCMSFSVL